MHKLSLRFSLCFTLPLLLLMGVLASCSNYQRQRPRSGQAEDGVLTYEIRQGETLLGKHMVRSSGHPLQFQSSIAEPAGKALGIETEWQFTDFSSHGMEGHFKLTDPQGILGEWDLQSGPVGEWVFSTTGRSGQPIDIHLTFHPYTP